MEFIYGVVLFALKSLWIAVLAVAVAFAVIDKVRK
jgi:hypothetical protein